MSTKLQSLTEGWPMASHTSTVVLANNIAATDRAHPSVKPAALSFTDPLIGNWFHLTKLA